MMERMWFWWKLSGRVIVAGEHEIEVLPTIYKRVQGLQLDSDHETMTPVEQSCGNAGRRGQPVGLDDYVTGRSATQAHGGAVRKWFRSMLMRL